MYTVVVESRITVAYNPYCYGISIWDLTVTAVYGYAMEIDMVMVHEFKVDPGEMPTSKQNERTTM